MLSRRYRHMASCPSFGQPLPPGVTVCPECGEAAAEAATLPPVHRGRMGFVALWMRMLGFIASLGMAAATAHWAYQVFSGNPQDTFPGSGDSGIWLSVIVLAVLFVLCSLFVALAYRAWPRE